jgi:DNA (cytosine-5)-methyltransferase 1
MKKQRKAFEIADLFCGAGGTSEGAEQALRSLGYSPRLTAVNHWDIAVATHTANHPDARHFCASVDSLNPRDIFNGRTLDLLWASPECTHHSIARGGAPVNDQSRATAWCVVRWAEALRPNIVLVENVPEFESWGPVTSGPHPRPIASKRGQTFRAWVAAMESLGYRSDHTILCAADFGDPTTRRRLFVQFVRGRRNIVWPTPTHGNAGGDLFGTRQPWSAARDIIDWDNKGKSIYSRKHPLSNTTMRRILAGLKKFGLSPFVLGQQTCSAPRSVDAPVPTVSTSGAIAFVEPFVFSLTHHGVDGSRCYPVSDPLPTVTCAHRGELGLVDPYLVGFHGDTEGNERVRSVDAPLPTVDCSPRFGLAEPYLVELRGTAPHQVDASARSVMNPLGTVTAGGGHFGLCEPFLVSYYGTGNAHSVDEPLPTVTCKDRFGLARPVVVVEGKRYLVDILFRMLAPSELSGAMGFPSDYKFTGNKSEVVRQIGNAVPCGLSRALVLASVSQNSSAAREFQDEDLNR